MQDFKGKLAVVTGGGTGMGRELVRQLAAEGCSVAMCDVSAEAMAETQALCAEDGRRSRRCASPRTSPTSPTRRRCSRFRDAVAERARDRQDPPALQQRRHRRRRQPVHRQPRASGRRPSTSAGAASTTARAPSCRCWCKADEGAHRQHQQRQRLLGLARPGRAAHRLQRRQVRGEGLHRGADHRPAASTRRTSSARS